MYMYTLRIVEQSGSGFPDKFLVNWYAPDFNINIDESIIVKGKEWFVDKIVHISPKTIELQVRPSLVATLVAVTEGTIVGYEQITRDK